ncbi:hypothetical protein B0A50_03004 [Salinomyces thailandicus]|uniref:Uncharacterized protein n=1 Tax=Salinomyces thailandicus TaxID=706561 RepID=A0A4U0U1K0_9PEZI|nr:hypothetical protein B0A50_03004 [Salinomyces thailandica]
MSPHRLPRNILAHRLAAQSLYRAILSQVRCLPSAPTTTTSAPSTQPDPHALQNLVRTRFKQTVHDHSPHRLRLAFTAGYQALDHLDAAVAGSTTSQTYLADLLSRVPEHTKTHSPPSVPPRHLRRERAKAARAAQRAQNPPRAAIPLSARPLPLQKLTGRRHVPVLYSAQRIPVLRFTKPQPPALSGYLAHRIRRRQRKRDQLGRLEAELEVAGWEDEWDRILGMKGGGEGDESWKGVVARARGQVGGWLAREREASRKWGAMMQEVVDREREAREKEKGEKYAERKRAWWGRVRERRREEARSGNSGGGNHVSPQ